MKTTSLVSLFALSLAAIQAGCALDAHDEESGGAEARPHFLPVGLDGRGPAIKLIALTPIAPDSAPALGHLADRFDVVDAAGGTFATAELEGLLEGAAAIVADAQQLGEERLEAVRPLVNAATHAGVPFILENVRDPDRMSRLVGVGFVAEAALVEPWKGQPRSDVTLFDAGNIETKATEDVLRRRAELGLEYWEMDEQARASLAAQLGVSRDELAERASEGLAELADADRARPEKPRDPALSPSVKVDPEALAEELSARLVERAENPPMQAMSASVSPTYAPGTYWSYLVHQAAVTWCPGYASCAPGQQKATMDVQFQLQLMASRTPGGKFLVVSDAGSGFNPGTLTWNSDTDRGYFQDALEVSISPSSPSLSHYSHQPTTPNQQNQYSVSNGCDFGGGLGADGPSASFSCNVGTSASQSVNDFTILDQAAGLVARWDYNMSFAPGYGVISGGAYDSWDDLVDPWFGYLRDVPALAKSNLDPFFEVVYRADSAFNGTVPLTLAYRQTLRQTWIEWYLLLVDAHSQSYLSTISLASSVDFGQVNIDFVPLVAKHSDKCLAVEDASTAQGARIVQQTCNGGDEQRFELVSTADQDGYSWIKPRNSGLCLTVNNGATGNGAKIIQMPCSASKDHQRFQVVDSGSEHSYLKAKHSQKCVRVDGSSTADGAYAVQHSCTGGDDERFR